MNKIYLVLSVLLLAIEFYIGLYVHDTIVRPYIGDLLVAILIYCVVKTIMDTPYFKTTVYVLIFCYAVEISQYYHLIYYLELQNSRIAHMLLGSSFSWIDMLCYTIGMVIVMILENIQVNRKANIA